ncbi:unnamed protein product [Caenorhabditis auriculariae]|uniref:Uncharacterized protein n=1 Tax=Caenorhabditis auriculariae TaxID=2777116 RepID=A0A8S1HCS7_9PELO|nr:unnamed protein product [Caenorhabditis auriculariae]
MVGLRRPRADRRLPLNDDRRPWSASLLLRPSPRSTCSLDPCAVYVRGLCSGRSVSQRGTRCGLTHAVERHCETQRENDIWRSHDLCLVLDDDDVVEKERRRL